MKVSIEKGAVAGKVSAPSSKSYTIRGLICAAMAKGGSEIVGPLGSDDTEAAWGVLGKLGVHIREEGNTWKVRGGDFHAPETDLFCGDSAATLRFMTAVCSVVPGKCRLTAGPSLAKRSVRPLVDALRQLGVECSCRGDVAPVIVEGGTLKGGTAELRGDISSQFVSALLLVAPLAEKPVKVRLTTPLESVPYVQMTLECLDKFGISVVHSRDMREFDAVRQVFRPARYEVEGDWSSASYFLALAAAGGELEVSNLNPESLQGDRVFIDFLREMGASVKLDRNSVTVCRAKLRAIRANLTDCIDLLPTIAVLAALAEGTSELAGIQRARLKESDRVAALKEGLERMGVEVKEETDRLLITGSTPRGAVIDSRADHRIAMAFSVIGASAGGTTIEDAGCVAKTYPGFWQALQKVGGKLTFYGQ